MGRESLLEPGMIFLRKIFWYSNGEIYPFYPKYSLRRRKTGGLSRSTTDTPPSWIRIR
jgi:hypothetical protein